MARIGIIVLAGWLALACAALAGPGPAELPPPGYAPRQYIDSTGCAYLREGHGWQARLDLDGQAICGYPPSAAMVPAALGAGYPADPSLAMPGMDEIEARLLAAVTGEMREGDYVGRGSGDDRTVTAADLSEGPVATAADLPPPATPPLATPPPATPLLAETPDAADPAMDAGRQLAAAVTAAPAIAAVGAGDLHPDDRLCALIGAKPRGAASNAPTLGGDPTGGYCAAALLGLPGPERGVGVGAEKAGAAPPVTVAGRRIASAAARDPSPRRVAATRPGVTRRPDAASRPRPATLPMIPAGARWLEVGRFTEPQSADAAAARLRAAGFPVGRSSRGGQVQVLAGPFASRQAIVTARDRLIRGGWRSVVAR